MSFNRSLILFGTTVPWDTNQLLKKKKTRSVYSKWKDLYKYMRLKKIQSTVYVYFYVENIYVEKCIEIKQDQISHSVVSDSL